MATPLPFAVGAGDGGDGQHGVYYQAYPGERPVLSGGRQVTGWQQAGGHIWSAAVPRDWSFRQLFVNNVRAVRLNLLKFSNTLITLNPVGFRILTI